MAKLTYQDHKYIGLLKNLMEILRVREPVFQRIMEAHRAGWHRESDGGTVAPEFEWRIFPKPYNKHPVHVTHDYLLALKIVSWAEADQIHRDGFIDFGHPYAARVMYCGTRINSYSNGHIVRVIHRIKGTHPKISSSSESA